MKRYKICPSCGTHNDPSAIECINCEEDLMNVKITDEDAVKEVVEEKPAKKVRMVKICYCGAKNPANARKCLECGDDISTIIAQPDVVEEKHVILNALDSDYSFEIKEGKTTVGRDHAMSDYLKDKVFVSRRHADLIKEGNKLFIKSYGTNHTFINNVQISEDELTEIKEGDVISFGGREDNGERQKEAAYLKVENK